MRPFVERRHEPAKLQAMLAHVDAGHGQVVGIVGDPDVGKTRMLYEFRQILQGRQVTWWSGRCLPYGPAPPYGPLLHLLWNACGLSETEGPEAITAKVHQRLQRCGMVPSEATPLQIPDTVWAVLSARIDRLPPAAKRVLQGAAVIGREVPGALLQALTTVPEAALHEPFGRS